MTSDTSRQGSDFVTVYVRRTNTPFTKETNKEKDPGRLSEEINFVKFSGVSWTPDSSGFFYQVCTYYFHIHPCR